MKSIVFALAFCVGVQAAPFKSGVTMPAGGHVAPAGKAPAPKIGGQSKKPEGKTDLEQRAETYYLKSFVPGPAGMRVMTADASTEAPEEMPGWPGKTRVKGSVRLRVTYKGKDQEETRHFEAILENGQVTEFTAR